MSAPSRRSGPPRCTRRRRGLLDDLQAEQEGRSTSTWSTGLDDVDKLLGGGIRPGELVIVAGRPSMGKTALALRFTEALAQQGRRVGVFSLETRDKGLAARILSSFAGVPLWRLRQPQHLHSDEWESLLGWAEDFERWPICINTRPRITISQLASQAERWKLEGGLGAVVVDYLQLMGAHDRRASRERVVAEQSSGLKALALELDIPVVALSQLNREVEKRTDKRPVISDLRESGQIEQDADVIGFVYRDHVYSEAAEPGEAEFIVRKQRNGPTGTVKLTWDRQLTRFDGIRRAQGALV